MLHRYLFISKRHIDTHPCRVRIATLRQIIIEHSKTVHDQARKIQFCADGYHKTRTLQTRPLPRHLTRALRLLLDKDCLLEATNCPKRTTYLLIQNPPPLPQIRSILVLLSHIIVYFSPPTSSHLAKNLIRCSGIHSSSVDSPIHSATGRVIMPSKRST